MGSQMVGFISIVALIFLSLLGYSIGAISVAGKSRDLKPVISDLVLVILIWAGAIYSRAALHVNRWLLILILLIAASFIGMASVLLRWHSLRIIGNASKEPATSANKHVYRPWRSFSLRLGSFQSRILLSLFFFIFITPAAILVKAFSDPLKIKKHDEASSWLSKEEIETDLKQYRRQF
jgi:hypothetical protein